MFIDEHRVLLISKTEVFTDDWSYETCISRLVKLAIHRLGFKPKWSEYHKSLVDRCYVRVDKQIFIKIK